MRDFPLMALGALILTAIAFGFNGAAAAQETAVGPGSQPDLLNSDANGDGVGNNGQICGWPY